MYDLRLVSTLLFIALSFFNGEVSGINHDCRISRDSVSENDFIVHSTILRTRCIYLSTETLKILGKDDIGQFSQQLMSQMIKSQPRFLKLAQQHRFSMSEDLYSLAIQGIVLSDKDLKKVRNKIIADYATTIEMLLQHYILALSQEESDLIKAFAKAEILELTNLKQALQQLK